MTDVELKAWANTWAYSPWEHERRTSSAILALIRDRDEVREKAEALARAVEVLIGNAEDALTLVGLQANGESENRTGPWTRRYDEMADALRVAKSELAAWRKG